MTKNKPPILMKIRGGVEVDSYGKKAGNGPLISENLSRTLGTSQDQYLFQPIFFEAYQHHGWRQNNVAGTLTAGQNDGVRGDTPVIVCIEGNGSRPSHKGDGYKVTDKMYTLNTIDRPAVVAILRLDNGSVDPLVRGDKSPTIRRGNGPGGTGHVAVCYGISSMGSNAMLSDNPHSGIYEAKIARTLYLNGGNPTCNQGGIMVVEQSKSESDVTGIDCRNGTLTGQITHTIQAKPNGGRSLNCTPCVICLDRASFNQETNAKYNISIADDGIMQTIIAKGPNAVCVADNYSGEDDLIMNEINYIVRRLTPTECCRLQGFPDGWGEIDPKEDFTDEEYRFWLDVRNTHAAINGKKTGNYTKDQMLTWYNKLHSDSNEYKMWGNGIALPNALYVMEGIAEELEVEE